MRGRDRRRLISITSVGRFRPGGSVGHARAVLLSATGQSPLALDIGPVLKAWPDGPDRDGTPFAGSLVRPWVNGLTEVKVRHAGGGIL